MSVADKVKQTETSWLQPEQLVYYGALAALAVFEVLEWPIALAIGAGHALAQNRHNRVVQELGEALETA
ncbi:hypothetical protein [Mycolicibacterium sp. CBMA 226]|uniref:hypothetical protein n=1 Tax=Mycolicibacterium sp. CBMA 226 TaxID=2606611 RepID=UPI001FB5F265|nr:hypothetical protein [Mycolicibacterium sp. CBMA 226]